MKVCWIHFIFKSCACVLGKYYLDFAEGLVFSEHAVMCLQDRRFPDGLGVGSNRAHSVLALPITDGNCVVLGEWSPAVKDHRSRTPTHTRALTCLSLSYTHTTTNTTHTWTARWLYVESVVGAVEFYRYSKYSHFTEEEEEVRKNYIHEISGTLTYCLFLFITFLK